jgi:hypothetical protein
MTLSRGEMYADWMADAIVSENRLRSASRGAATGPGYASGSYRPKREEQNGQQWGY